jgi:hypothetical protein
MGDRLSKSWQGNEMKPRQRPCPALPCRAVPGRVTHTTPHHTMPCHAMPCHAMPYHPIPCRLPAEGTIQPKDRPAEGLDPLSACPTVSPCRPFAFPHFLRGTHPLGNAQTHSEMQRTLVQIAKAHFPIDFPTHTTPHHTTSPHLTSPHRGCSPFPRSKWNGLLVRNERPPLRMGLCISE